MSPSGIIALTIIGIFSLFIIRKDGKLASDYLLLLINAVLAITIYSEFAVFHKNEHGINLFIHFNAAFWFVSAFIMYAYSIINGSLVIKWWHFAFSLPFFLFSAIDLFIYHQGDSDHFEEILLEPTIYYHLFLKLNKIFLIGCGIDILNRIVKYNSDLKNSFSLIEDISLNWLRNFTVFIIFIYAFQLVAFLLYNFGVIPEIETVYFLIGVLIVLGLFYLSYNGIQQYNLVPSELDSDIISTHETYYQDSDISEENARILAQLVELFEKENIFKNPELRIAQVAEALDIQTHILSKAINTQFSKPFYDFVASYRVEYLKDQLIHADNSKYTILSLALDSGFNSKASMNRIFKDHTGVSPSEFQRTHFKNETHT